MNSRSISNLLNQENILQQWQNKAKQVEEIEHYWHTLLPPAWRSLNYVANLNEGEVLVCVTHNAVLSKIKQLEPSLLSKLSERYPGIISIKLKMAPSQPTMERIPPKNESLSVNTLNLFEETLAKINDGPVAEALQKLLSHHKKGGD
ncbi:MAG: DUF721 domain-containing protein [Betaproteobacteria bacterium]|nr:DUF721 domain-containing protein [Betaproteobacteria bacterium]